MNDRLFVYGTLMSGLVTPIATYLKNNSTFLGEAVLEGMLYDIGRYPGVIPRTGIDSWVQGHVFQLSNASKIWPIVDRYEGIGPEFPEPMEYIRLEVPILLDGETINCWVYQYNYSIEGLTIIRSGNYLEHLKESREGQDFLNNLSDFTRHE